MMGGMTYVALLRAVNVGGRNKLPMKDLAALFEAAGCSSVRTVIQSGNVVFQTNPNLAVATMKKVLDKVEAQFGFRPALLLRTLAEMLSVVQSNPFAGEEEKTYVYFLDRPPTAEAMSAIDPNRSPADRFVLVNKELYVLYSVASSDSKLTGAYLESKLSVVATARNWSATNKLLQIMQTAPI